MLEHTLNVVGACALMAAAFRSFKTVVAAREAEKAARQDEAEAEAMLEADTAGAAAAAPVLTPEAAAARAESSHWLQFWCVCKSVAVILFIHHVNTIYDQTNE